MTSPNEPWHLDKRVPIALIVTIVLQTAGLVWWAASLEGRLMRVERDTAALIAADAKINDDMRRAAEYLARLDERLASMSVTLREMRDELKSKR